MNVAINWYFYQYTDNLLYDVFDNTLQSHISKKYFKKCIDDS